MHSRERVWEKKPKKKNQTLSTHWNFRVGRKKSSQCRRRALNTHAMAILQIEGGRVVKEVIKKRKSADKAISELQQERFFEIMREKVDEGKREERKGEGQRRLLGRRVGRAKR